MRATWVCNFKKEKGSDLIGIASFSIFKIGNSYTVFDQCCKMPILQTSWNGEMSKIAKGYFKGQFAKLATLHDGRGESLSLQESVKLLF